jgi:hypothetical protein
MGTAMRELARPDAARRIVDCVFELAGAIKGREPRERSGAPGPPRVSA